VRSAAPEEPVSASRSEEQHQRRDSELHARYEAESPDPRWARDAAAAIGNSLKERAQNGTFTIGEIDCKTTLCKASVSWPSYPAAHSEFRRLLGLAVPCATEIFVPRPENEDRPYDATLMLDCEPWRTGGP
jgi:hypothetical protein